MKYETKTNNGINNAQTVNRLARKRVTFESCGTSTGERIIQKPLRIWAGGNSTRLYTNPPIVSVHGFATKTKALAHEILGSRKSSLAKSRQLRRLNISPFPKEHVRMHDSLASNNERGRSGMVWELKMVYEEEN